MIKKTIININVTQQFIFVYYTISFLFFLFPIQPPNKNYPKKNYISPTNFNITKLLQSIRKIFKRTMNPQLEVPSINQLNSIKIQQKQPTNKSSKSIHSDKKLHDSHQPQKKTLKKILTLLDSIVPQQNKTLTPSKKQLLTLKQNQNKDNQQLNKNTTQKQNKIDLLTDIFDKKIIPEIDQNHQQKINNAKQISDEVFKKLIYMSNSLALQTTSTNIQQSNGYFKDNIIKVTKFRLAQLQQSSIQSVKQNQTITSLWLGQVFDKCASSSFMHYISRNLDYNQAKTYCCQQILSNIIQAIRDGKSLKTVTRFPSTTTLHRRHQTRKQITYQQQPMKYINQQSSRILDHLCNKYPQSDTQGVNKKVQQLAKSLKIDNWMDDQYDLLRLSNINFVYKLTGDYSKQIMQALNLIIQLPFKQHNKYKQLTNYKQFQLTMNKIFQILYVKDNKNDINMVINQDGEFDLFSKKKLTQTEQQIEYRDKVKSYTAIQIGTKISGTTKPFSQEEIESQIIKIENNAVARVLDKWAEELGKKFLQAQKHVLNRKYRFKSADDKRFFKINDDMKQKLFKILCEKRKKLEKFTDELKQSIYDLSHKLAKNQSSDVSQLYFLDDRQKRVGQFAVKMAQSSSQYFIQVIQKEISLLLEAVDQMKKYWTSKHKFRQSPVYQSLNINLITYKIGDLMRCKIISNQDEIIRVLKLIKTLSEMWDQKFIKIIRVKNRLDYSTRDILINFMFDQLCPCELQLAVAEKTTQKKQYFDKFNHFLYELKRAYLGPIMQLCKIWSQYQSKSQTYAKQIQKSTKKKLKKMKKSLQPLQITSQTFNNVYQYKFPFLCTQCNIFTPRNNLIFFNLLIAGKIYCGNCVKNKICNGFNNNNNYQQITKKYILNKYFIRYPNINKLIDKLKEVKNFSDGCKYNFQINIPIKSHCIHMLFSMLVQLDRVDQQQENISSKKNQVNAFYQYVYVSTKFQADGKLDQQMRNVKYWKQKHISYQTSMQSIQQLQQSLQQNFITYVWDEPTLLLPLPDNPTQHYLELIDKFIPFIRKLEEETGHKSIKIGAVEVEKDKYYYFPFFIINELKISEQLIQKGNLELLHKTLAHKQQVLESSNRKITTQFQQLNHGIKLKIAYIIRQIYLNRNYLQNIDFIQHFHMLKIIQANKNNIQKIPNIPCGLEQLKLDQNKISKINHFNANSFQTRNNFKLKLLSLSMNQISKIENIENLIHLKHLILLKNKIKKIQGLPVGLERINFMQNQIQKIQNMTHLQKLKHISLTNNKITKIQNLQECKALTILILNHNKIPKIENLKGLQNLRTLHLSYTGLDSNLITSSKNNCYDGLRQLKKIKKLMMQNNKIKCFMEILGLIQSNPQTGETIINNINPYIELQEVSLAVNQLTDVDSFDKIMPLVSMLNLQNNQITKIDPILKLGMLTQLNVSNNLITQLPISGWQKLFKIQCINFNDNKIKIIPSLKSLSFSKYLYFERNLICRIQEFPIYPYGIPVFCREIYLTDNKLFQFDTSDEDFNQTIKSITNLNQQSIIYLTKNGNCPKKIDKLRQIKQLYNLQHTYIGLEEITSP